MADYNVKVPPLLPYVTETKATCASLIRIT